MERFRSHAGLCSWTDESKAAARPTKPNGNTNVEKGQPRKRNHATKDEGQSSEEEGPTRVKRARHEGKKDSIAAEVEDLVMFGESPIIIDQADTTRRYPLRTTRKDTKVSKRIETVEELVAESSAEEKYKDLPTQRYSFRKTRKVAKTRGNSRRVEQYSSESSAEEEEYYVPAQPTYPLRWFRTNGEPHRERDRVEVASQESSVETDDEELPADRFPFRRIPRYGETGGKSKGPSWVSSAKDQSQSNDETDYQHTAVSVNIGGRVHYATYEGLISNGPAHRVGGSGKLPQRQIPETLGASPAQSGLYPPQPHAFDVMMNMPCFEERSLEEEDTPLQAHRKRVRDFLENEAHSPPLKCLRQEQPVLPLPGSAKHGGTSKVPPQADQSSKTPHAQSSQAQNERVEAELAHRSVNYSEVPPRNSEEVQSLIDALLPTREVYFAWTGKQAPRTDPQESYRAQFDTIFWAFQDWWREHRLIEPLPILAGVFHWGRSVDDWEAPSKDSMYYEAFRKGHRTPRGGNGKIIDLSGIPGSRLEDAYRQKS